MTDQVDRGKDAGVGAGPQVSRRRFLTLGTIAGGTVAAACSTDSEPVAGTGGRIDDPQRPPLPPPTPRAPGVYEFFDRDEAQAVEAFAARIFPGSPDDPGAREAGVINYIDGKLARFEAFAEPTFMQAPFAEGYELVAPVLTGTVAVPQEELYRYGYQSGLTPQQLYRSGLEALDRYSEQRFEGRFVDLTEDQQDQVLTVLDEVGQRSEEGGDDSGSVSSGGGDDAGDEEGSGPADADLDAARGAFGDVDPGAFFATLRTDTLEGMFADPVYGGNRNLVGWTLLGYPGPQRAYSPEEMLNGTVRRTQSLDGLHPMNPDRASEHAPEALEQPRQGVTEG